MPRKSTPSFVVERRLCTNKDDEILLDKLGNAYKFSNEHVEEPKAIIG